MSNKFWYFKRVFAEGKAVILPSVLVTLFLLCGCNESVVYTEDEGVDEKVSAENIYSEYEESEGAGGVAGEEGDSGEYGAIGEANGNEAGAPPTEKLIMVHVCGAVENPGVYELHENDRIIDAVVIAGGFSENADENAINLASVATDGAKIYIPQIGEEYQTEEKMVEDSDKRVNINTANEDLLTTISGIGPSRAKAIIAYREEHGAFKTVEDITNVSGIGAASLEKIRDCITVN